MAVFTGNPLSATTYADQIDADRGYMADAGNVDGSLNRSFFSYTLTAAAGAGVGAINLIRLPAGRIRVFPETSYLNSSDMSANADLHLGHREYHNLDGTLVAEDDNEWIDNADAGGGALKGTWTEVGNATGTGYPGTVGLASAEYETVEGLTIFVTIDTGDMDVGDVIFGWVEWQKVG